LPLSPGKEGPGAGLLVEEVVEDELVRRYLKGDSDDASLFGR
jgi:hypothetical protein